MPVKKLEKVIVDSFAGGGGAGLGIAWATGRSADIAINHDADALAMYGRNHPDTRCVHEDVYKTDLRKLVAGRKVGLLWASPDCRDFSPWMIVKWADQVKPEVIILENVREFAEWGPIVPKWKCQACEWCGTEGQAILKSDRRRCPRCNSLRLQVTEQFLRDPKRKGLTFRRWLGRLRNLGYDVQYKTLDAADFGAPTHRKRLFLVARRDGRPIVWPEHTHASPKKLSATPLFGELKPWRTAAECIDWSIPCPSIFDRQKPLAEKTLRRIALGVKRYVLENPQPFVVQLAHGEGKAGRWGMGSRPLTEPLGTVHAGGNNFAITTPRLIHVTHGGDRRSHGPDEPLPTITTAHRGEVAIVSPTLIQTGYGERAGQAPRVPGLGKPLGTVVSGGSKHALVAAFLAKHFGGVVGVPADSPLPTTTVRGTQTQIVAANLVHMNHGEKQWNAMTDPLRTVTTGNHAALVYSFLVKYFGTAIGANLWEPMPTVTTKDRFGLVTVTISGELYIIVDIGMRMLMPRELARAQGFPDTYILWPKSKTKQTAFIGNSVSPYPAQAMVEANWCPSEVEVA